MDSLNNQLARAAQLLAPVTDTPRLDAEILMAHALRTTRSQLLTRLHHSVHVSGYDRLLERRLAHEPIAYITGHWGFYSIEFLVRAPLLVPRPETEHLVETVLASVGKAPRSILELGTGTGCVAVAIARNAPQCHIVATDIDPHALTVAKFNAAFATDEQDTALFDQIMLTESQPWNTFDGDFAARCMNGQRALTGSPDIEFLLGDLFGALTRDCPCFDVICSNPPYIADAEWPSLPAVVRLHESPLALLAGPDGLGVIERIAFEATAYLNPGGMLALEIGAGQCDSVKRILADNNYEHIEARRDLSGIERIAVARKPSR